MVAPNYGILWHLLPTLGLHLGSHPQTLRLPSLERALSRGWVEELRIELRGDRRGREMMEMLDVLFYYLPDATLGPNPLEGSGPNPLERSGVSIH